MATTRHVSTAEVRTYTEARQVSGAANGTINRELQILKRAFKLAQRAKKLTSAPYIPKLKEADARGARRAVLLGPDELARGAATVRVMASGEQHEVALDLLRNDPAAALAG